MFVGESVVSWLVDFLFLAFSCPKNVFLFFYFPCFFIFVFFTVCHPFVSICSSVFFVFFLSLFVANLVVDSSRLYLAGAVLCLHWLCPALFSLFDALPLPTLGLYFCLLRSLPSAPADMSASADMCLVWSACVCVCFFFADTGSVRQHDQHDQDGR